MAKAMMFVIRDEDVDKVMAAVEALQLTPPEEHDTGGFMLTRKPALMSTISGTNCSTTSFGSDGGCADCGLDA